MGLNSDVNGGVPELVVENVNPVQVDEHDSASAAGQNLTELEDGVAGPHTVRRVPAELFDALAQLLSVLIEATPSDNDCPPAWCLLPPY